MSSDRAQIAIQNEEKSTGPDASGAGAPARGPSHAERARGLAARARWGALSTVARDPPDFPYGSLVATTVDAQGRPLLLISRLAEHTKNLADRPEASILLLDTSDPATNPLAQGRVTLLGACRPVPAEEAAECRRIFLAAHPDSAQYADFDDFAFHRLEPAQLRYVGGFGRMSWIDAEDYRKAGPPVPVDEAG